MPTSGVYAIHLTGTPYVWVGESANVERRLRTHRIDWVWPNAATFDLVRAMPGSSTSQRHCTEEALSRLLRSRGYLMLSYTHSECAEIRKNRTVKRGGTPSGAKERAARNPEWYAQWRAAGTKASADARRIPEADRPARLRAKNRRRYQKDPEAARQRSQDYRERHPRPRLNADERSAAIKKAWDTRRARQNTGERA